MASLKVIAGMIAAAALCRPASAITFPTQMDQTTHLASTIFTGVGSLGTFSGSSYGHGCTASLVSANVVLTATHCLNSDPSYKFILPAAGDANLYGGSAYDIKSSLALPRYDGQGQSDLALITLSQLVSGDHQIYDIYSNHDEIGQQITMVGAGITGVLGDNVRINADHTAYLGNDRLRWGTNRYDGTGALIGEREDQLVMDNDDGTDEHDVFGRLAGVHDTGIRDATGKVIDDGLLYGDSGGPDFIDGLIAGVHSFAGDGSPLFSTDGSSSCGTPGSVDPVPVGEIGTCVDGSYGDIGGSMRVSYYADAIRSYIGAAAVPEPASWLTMLSGFAMIGLLLRRRTRMLTHMIAST